jgi:Gram-negative bacterial TonB protein C-terminal
MSVIIALVLAQAATMESTLYHSADGFLVGKGDHSCILIANYKNGIETSIFSKEKDIYLIIRKKNWNPVSKKRYKFKVLFDDYEYDLTTTASENGAFLDTLHPDFLNSYAMSGSLEIMWGKNSIATLNLSGSSKAITAFRSCMKDSGFSLPAPLVQPASKAPDQKDPFDRSVPAKLENFRELKYPKEASGAGGGAKVAVKVGINERAFDCTVLETSGSAVLDNAACEWLRGSYFRVARDKAGQPIQSVIELSVPFEDPSKTVEPD